MFSLLVPLLALLPLTANALRASDANVIDWKLTHIGVPKYYNPSTAPLFHRVTGPKGQAQMAIVTATESNVLAAVNPSTGKPVWRRVFEENDPLLSFKTHKDGCALISGPGGSKLRLFEVLTGHLIWELQLHRPQLGLLTTPPQLGSFITFDPIAEFAADLFVLTNGNTVRRVAGMTGAFLWEWNLPNGEHSALFSKLVLTPEGVFVIGTAKHDTTQLSITILDPLNGVVLDSYLVAGELSTPNVEVLYSSDVSAPALAWLSDTKVQYVILEKFVKLRRPAVLSVGLQVKEIIDVGLTHVGRFVVVTSDDSAHALQLAGGQLQSSWKYGDIAPSSQQSRSVFAGGVDKEGRPYIARIYWTHLHRQASFHVYYAHGAGGKGVMSGFMFPFDPSAHGVITHATLDLVHPQGSGVIARAFLTTSTGSVQLWQQEELQWMNEESLADIQALEFVDLPEKQTLASLSNKGFIARLLRHTIDLKNLPAYLQSFGKRFIGQQPPVESSEGIILERDALGFKKLVIALTSTGKIFALDTVKGQVVWSRVLGLYTGANTKPARIFATKGVAQNSVPQLSVVAERQADTTSFETVLWPLNALDGSLIETGRQVTYASGWKLFDGRLHDAFLMETSDAAPPAVIVVSQDLKLFPLRLQPSDRSLSHAVLENIHIPIILGEGPHRRLVGHQVDLRQVRVQNGPTFHQLYPTWQASFPDSEVPETVFPRHNQPVASYGVGVRDRKTLYKYLNSKLMAVSTTSPVTHAQSIYLIDAAKGSIIYTSPVQTDGTPFSQVALMDNWLVYAHRHNIGNTQLITSVELFEGQTHDNRTRSAELHSMSADLTSYHVSSRTYMFPRGIRALGLTRTKYGISSTDLIVSTANGQVQAIPQRFVDARRPHAQPSGQEPDPFLIPYDPVTADDPRRVLSHQHELFMARHIVSSPSALESTSLLLAYGIDIFFSHVTPSGTFDVLSSSFNKLQLVATIIALSLAVMGARPMVARKVLKEAWYS